MNTEDFNKVVAALVEKMNKIFRSKYYWYFIFIVVMPLNGWIMARKSISLGLILIFMQVPSMLLHMEDDMQDTKRKYEY